jgi:hypothetical protein
MSLAEPTITPCAPGRRTPKDQIRLRERPPVSGTIIRISGQSMLTPKQQEDEAEIMSVALKQPHRRGEPDLRLFQQTDANYATSELGKFVRRFHETGGDVPMAYRQSTAFMRYRAGMDYAMAINDDLVARGLAGSQRGDAEFSGVPSDADLRIRIEKCAIFRANAEDAARGIDRRAPEALERLCYRDEPLPDRLHGLAKHALYAVSLHFGIEKHGYHENHR